MSTKDKPTETNANSKKIPSWFSKIFGVVFSLSPIKIGILIMMVCMGSLIRHYQLPKGPGAPLDWVGVIERNLYDIRFKLRGPVPVSDDVGVLAVDEESVAKFGRWPFPRSVYEKVISNLKKRGVKWIGFDSVFSEPERPYLDESVEGIQNALNTALEGKGFDADKFSASMESIMAVSQGDESFGNALGDFKNIVHGYFYFEERAAQADLNYNWIQNAGRLKNSVIEFVSFENNQTLKDFPEMLTYGVVSNTDVISGKQSNQGFFNNRADPDGIVRSATLIRGVVPLSADGKEASPPILVPSLPLNLAAKYLRREIMVKFDTIGVKSIELMDPSGNSDPLKIPVTLDGAGRMLINHYGRELTFPHLSLARVYENQFPSKVPKVLIFGAVGTGLSDIRPSPFSESFNGVEHHTAVLENILSENFLNRPVSAFFIELGMLFVTGIIYSFALKYMSALSSAAILTTFSLGFFFIDHYFLFGKGQWFYIGIFYLQSFSIYFGVTLFKYFTEEKEKKKIKNAFQHYLNPAVINDLMENPDQLCLGGQKKELTVFFSDVRGFTTISETLTPEALTNLLNEYFTPMTGIILQSNGLLDKYMGDAIMAFWGAPIDLKDHADRGLKSSLLMLDALDVLKGKWKERGLPIIDIGIGLNTGSMIVGNMGSDQRFDYTVLGDAVNLGSRLESINKQYGTRIICSEFTKLKVINPQEFLFRELDDIQVKGKTEPVKIFELVRFGPDRRAFFDEIVQTFEEGLGLYRQQSWDAAEKLFCEILRKHPDDGPAGEFLERCSYLRDHTPGDNWNGVWIMKTK